MKKFYISECTEYEAGWGSRPDGFIIAEDLEDLKSAIVKGSTGDRDLFWRYSEPREIFCELKTYRDLIKKINDDKIINLNKSERYKLDLFIKF